MSKRLLHTPDGVMDIYNGQCERKHVLVTKILHQIHLHSFKDIQTPVFEYFDVFNQGNQSLSSREMYKFIDRDGDTMVLRPDITPSIARAFVKYFSEEKLPVRFSYKGNTYINHKNYQGKLKEQTQIGAELINDDSVFADAEMIILTVECLKAAGLSDFQVELGHAGFFSGLIKEAAFDEDTVIELKSLIENKNYFGIEELLSDKQVSNELKKVFVKLPEMFGQAQTIYDALAVVHNEESRAALERIEKIYDILRLTGNDAYVSFDLGMLSSYDYYTGIIFKAYTYGTGDAVITGGRYDNMLSKFGKNAPAIGLAVMADELLSALNRQKIKYDLKDDDILILYSEERISEAIAKANELRNSGSCVNLLETSHPELSGIDFSKQKAHIDVVHGADEADEKLMAYAKRAEASDVYVFV